MKTTLASLFVLSLGLPFGGADVSPECEMETTALGNNPTLEAAFNQSIASVTFTQDDCVVSGGDTLTCTIDLTEMSGEFATACAAAGGQLFTTDIQLECSDSEVTFAFIYNEQPACIGASCDPDNFDATLDSNIQALEALVEADNPDLECDFDVGDITGGGGSGAFSNRPVSALLAGAVVSLVAFL